MYSCVSVVKFEDVHGRGRREKARYFQSLAALLGRVSVRRAADAAQLGLSLLGAAVGAGHGRVFCSIGFGSYHEAGIIQSASLQISHLLRWIVLGSAVIICVLTAGSISSERGTMADSVLSRGISRHQYFLGKWHARLATVLGTFRGPGRVDAD